MFEVLLTQQFEKLKYSEQRNSKKKSKNKYDFSCYMFSFIQLEF